MELFRALGCLLEEPSAANARFCELLDLGPPPTPAEHTEVFVLQLYPYASVYLGVGGQLGGEARDHIAGFWRVLGEEPAQEPDHLALLLATYARLLDLESEDSLHREQWRHARLAFLSEHLLSWLPVYLDKLEGLDSPFYAGWAKLTREALLTAAQDLPAATSLPLALRSAPALSDPRVDGGKAFLSSLLSPVESGWILTRTDLARAAAALELGLRRGERRFQLEVLLGQNDAGMLGWLAEEATAASRRHQALGFPSGPFWAERAATSATLLSGLREQIQVLGNESAEARSDSNLNL